jgi:hypothetical protein
MTSTQHDDQDPNAANEERKRYLRQTFHDESIFVGLATDQPVRPSRPTLGQRVVQDRRKRQREARRERNQETMRQAVVAEDKAAAYARVVADVQARKMPTDQDLELAAAHALETGVVNPPTSIERLLDQSRKARRFEPMDDGDEAA